MIENNWEFLSRANVHEWMTLRLMDMSVTSGIPAGELADMTVAELEILEEQLGMPPMKLVGDAE